MKERVINAFIDTVSAWFIAHPESKTLVIGKGALAFKCGIGLTSMEALCQGMALETVSIKDLVGKIEVDRAGFIEWYNAKLDSRREKAIADNKLFYMNQEAYGPLRELNYQKSRIETARKNLEKLKQSVPEAKAEADRLEAEAREEAERQKTPEEIAAEKMRKYREEHGLDDEEEYSDEEY